MNLVIDANILFAALIKNNITRFLLFREDINLYAPEFIFVEVNKYLKDIAAKSGKTTEEVLQVLEVLMRRVTLILESEIISYINYAGKISPDIKDVPYLALALKLNCPLWSNDSKLKIQKIVSIYSTEELLKR